MTGKKLKADLHIHTSRSKDSRASPESVVRKALELGFGAIAVTDHNSVQGSLDAERAARGTGLLVIPGQEVLTSDGELIVLGIRKDLPQGLSAGETACLAKESGGFVIAPHPFDLMRRGIGRSLGPSLNHIDAVEVFNARTLFRAFNDKAMAFARARGLPVTCGSDSHFLQEMGKSYMLLDSGKDQESVFRAIRGNRARLVMRQQGRVSKLRRGLLKVRTYF